MDKYVVVLTAPTMHMMFDKFDNIKAYQIECESQNFDYEVERKQRQFSLETKAALADVELLLAYKMKAQI